MSLYYTHLLIPLSPEYRPEPDAVAAWTRGLIGNGNVASRFTISLSRITKREPAVRKVLNTVTGETIDFRMPSRKVEQPQILTGASQIVEYASNQREYDAVISSEGTPAVSPCSVGYVENERWIPVVDDYHLEIRCRVRKNVVKLSMLESEDELDRPADLAKWQPRFDEDCSIDERDGISVHPEIGGIRITNAGCATFWIEFKYGKFIFPLSKENGLNILDNSIITLARKTFGVDFVQASQWG